MRGSRHAAPSLDFCRSSQLIFQTRVRPDPLVIVRVVKIRRSGSCATRNRLEVVKPVQGHRKISARDGTTTSRQTLIPSRVSRLNCATKCQRKGRPLGLFRKGSHAMILPPLPAFSKLHRRTNATPTRPRARSPRRF